MAFGAAIRAGRAFVDLSLRDHGFRRGLRRASQDLQQTLTNMQSVGIAGTLLGGGIITALYGMARAASDYNEAINLATVAFEENAQVTIDWAEKSASAWGLSKRAALEYASTLGIMLKDTGLDSKQLGKAARNLVRAAADLASAVNITTDEALQVIKATGAGEIEALRRRIGIGLDDVRTKQKAVSLGLAENTNEVSQNAKMLSRSFLILEEMGKRGVLGDFMRTRYELANAFRVLGAVWEDFKADVGTPLVIWFSKAAEAAIAFLKVFGKLAKESPKIQQALLGIAVGITAVFSAMALFATTAMTLWLLTPFVTLIGSLINPWTWLGLAIAGAVGYLALFVARLKITHGFVRNMSKSMSDSIVTWKMGIEAMTNSLKNEDLDSALRSMSLTIKIWWTQLLLDLHREFIAWSAMLQVEIRTKVLPGILHGFRQAISGMAGLPQTGGGGDRGAEGRPEWIDEWEASIERMTKELEGINEDQKRRLKELQDEYEKVGFDGAGTGGGGLAAGLGGLGASRGTFIGAAASQLGGGTLFEKVAATVKKIEKELEKQTELNTGQLSAQEDMKKLHEESVRRMQNQQFPVLILE